MKNKYYLNDKIIQLVKDSGLNQKEFSEKYKVNYHSLNHVYTKENVCGWNFFKQVITNMNLTLKIEVCQN